MKLRYGCHVCWIAVVVGWSCAAQAQVHVEYWNGSAWIPLVDPPYPAGSSVTINNAGSLRYMIYTTTPGSQNIGSVAINSSVGDTPTLLVCTGLNEPSESILPGAAAQDVGAISFSGGTLDLQVRVNHDATGDIGATHIYRIDAGGTIAGNVLHNPGPISNPARLGFVTATYLGSTSGAKSITAKYGDILNITTTGTIFSDIIASSGSIGTIQTTGQTGGINSAKIQALSGSISDIISAYYIGAGLGGDDKAVIQAKYGIHLVQAGANSPNFTSFIRAAITANVNNATSSSSGDITRLETLTSNPQFPAHFYGSLNANRALGESTLPALNIAGDLNADLDITQSFGNSMIIHGILSSGRTIRIAHDFEAGGLINIQGNTPYGLAGQIIINSSGGNYHWINTPNGSGLIDLSDSIFDHYFLEVAPFYDQLSSQIGGGAVGEAPFNCHLLDCLPPHNAGISITELPIPVVVRHYGPVVNTGTGSCLKIYARAFGAQQYTDYTSDFKVIAGKGTGMREVWITENSTRIVGFAPLYEYLIAPVLDTQSPNVLRCLSVDGTPPVHDYSYHFLLYH